MKIKINKLEQKRDMANITYPMHLNSCWSGWWRWTVAFLLGWLETSRYIQSKREFCHYHSYKNRLAKSKECQGPLRRLARVSKNYSEKPILDLRHNDSLKGILPLSLPGNLKDSLKYRAIKFYQEWKETGAKNPFFGDILINRTGWSHITRKGRPIARIEASFGLLPIAARIINEVSRWRMLTPMRRYDNRKDGFTSIVDFVGLTAKVILKNRSSAEVMVVLKER